MSFREHVPTDKRTIDGVRISIKRGGPKDSLIVRIGFGQTAIDALGIWAGDRIQISVGEDKNEGSIRIEKSAHGWKLIARLRSLFVGIRLWQGVPKEKRGAVDCEYTISGKTLIVTLPDWQDGAGCDKIFHDDPEAKKPAVKHPQAGGIHAHRETE
jgi:hypothetical protein